MHSLTTFSSPGLSQFQLYTSLIPRPPLFYLPFAFTIIPQASPVLPSVYVHNNPVLIFTDLLIQIVNAKGRSKRGTPGTEASFTL